MAPWIGARISYSSDFGTAWNGVPIGIPYVVVPENQPKVPVRFEYADGSDNGPYPIPANPPIEGAMQEKETVISSLLIEITAHCTNSSPPIKRATTGGQILALSLT